MGLLDSLETLKPVPEVDPSESILAPEALVAQPAPAQEISSISTQKRGRPEGSKNKSSSPDAIISDYLEDQTNPTQAQISSSYKTMTVTHIEGPVLTPGPPEADKEREERVDEAIRETLSYNFVLLINCISSDTKVLHLDEFVRKCCLELENATGVKDYRLVDYGKGAGILAAVARDNAKELKGTVCIFTDGGASSVVAEALSGIAAERIRGLR
jgi:hypothetical protein